jgi:hypothetical protein
MIPCNLTLKRATHALADLVLNVGYAWEVLLQFGQGSVVLFQLADLLGLGHLSTVSFQGAHE